MNETLTPAIMDIVDIHTEAVKVQAETLQAGDKVFDVWGKQYELKRVQVFKRVVKYWHEDNMQNPGYLDVGDSITIIRK